MSINKEHAQMVQTLKSKDYQSIYERMTHAETIDLVHGVFGLYSEGGEVADNLKRHIFYGTDLDVTNVIEECGDKLWYIQLILAAVDSSLDEALEKNKGKLFKRYGDKFSEHAAINRDLDAEREILDA